MKVIVATRRDQGTQPDDYAWTLDGELVHLPVIECGSAGRCGCERGFAGVASRRATTTAEVAERELTRAQVIDAVYDSLVDGGYVEPDLPGQVREGRRLAREVIGDLLDAAAGLPVGTVVGRYRDRLLVREPAPDAT